MRTALAAAVVVSAVLLPAVSPGCGTDLQQAVTPTSDDSGGDSVGITTLPGPQTAGQGISAGSEGTSGGVDTNGDAPTSTEGVEAGTTTGNSDTTAADEGTATATTNGTCGDGTIDLGEDCDGAELAGATCGGLEEFFGGELSCAAACTFDTTGCWLAPHPAAGELVISEIMQNPGALADELGEWFEVHNPGGSARELGGCTIDGNANDLGLVVAGSLVVAPGAWVTFATDSVGGPGFVPDYTWTRSSFGLNNGSDEIRITCSSGLVDAVAYDDGTTFPDPNGATMTLDPTQLDAAANDNGANWCLGTTDFNLGDLGTPGLPNDVCG